MVDNSMKQKLHSIAQCRYLYCRTKSLSAMENGRYLCDKYTETAETKDEYCERRARDELDTMETKAVFSSHRESHQENNGVLLHKEGMLQLRKHTQAIPVPYVTQIQLSIVGFFWHFFSRICLSMNERV